MFTTITSPASMTAVARIVAVAAGAAVPAKNKRKSKGAQTAESRPSVPLLCCLNVLLQYLIQESQNGILGNIPDILVGNLALFEHVETRYAYNAVLG